MKTIFDYLITSSELDYLRVKSRSKEEYLEGINDYRRLSDLFVLFRLRGDKENADKIMQEMKRSNKES